MASVFTGFTIFLWFVAYKKKYFLHNEHLLNILLMLIILLLQDYSENSIVEMKFKLITCCPFLLKIENSETIIDNILEVWKNLTRRAYSYYRMAAMSYLQYLQLNGKVSIRPVIV